MDKAAGPVFMCFTGTLPMNCTPASAKRLATAAARYKDLSAGTRRSLLDVHQEDKRCLMIRPGGRRSGSNKTLQGL